MAWHGIKHLSHTLTQSSAFERAIHFVTIHFCYFRDYFLVLFRALNCVCIAAPIPVSKFDVAGVAITVSVVTVLLVALAAAVFMYHKKCKNDEDGNNNQELQPLNGKHNILWQSYAINVQQWLKYHGLHCRASLCLQRLALLMAIGHVWPSQNQRP